MDHLAGASNQMEKCLFRKEVVKVPLALVQDVDVFREVVSPSTWQKVLTDAQRRHLLKFLPSFPQNDVPEKQDTLRKLMGGQNIKFGNPVKQFHSRLKEGLFSPDIAKYTELCRKARKKEYNYQQQVHYSTLLQEIIVNRQRILEAAYKTPLGEPLQLDPLEYLPPPKERSLQFRIKKHYKRVIREVHEEAGASDCSSESDDEWSMRRTQKPMFKAEDSPEGKNIQPTFGHKRHSVMGSGDGFSDFRDFSDPTQGRSTSPSEDITDDDFQELLKRHRKRRMNAEETDDLDTRGINMEGIMTRCHTSKRNARQQQNGVGVAKKKPKLKMEKKQMKIKDMDLSPPPTSMIGQPQMTEMSGESALFSSYSGQRMPVKEEDDEHLQELSDDIDVETDLETPPRILSQPRTDFGLHACFFSLLRDLVCEDADSKTSTMKLEEKVREWQDCAASSRNVWITEQPSWVDVVASALRFMSGDVIGLTLENFVPLVDYKERAQQWRWIGRGRDGDETLTPLCKHWLENKDEMSLDINDRADAATPPPRSRTNYVVRPSSEEEKDLFREQEEIRFQNPHRAFTYHLHQYESVVGPVKGVYNKESPMNKAREHAILVKERPSYVTILTLVRDAAARLPNGEGTRADICELLKDSQFISPNVTDGQINTVVSGALDRLHYEKDPCVKYDVNRKLWIYLHRNREEIDFERIHQAQGAAAKAKKALTKPKPSKKSKEASAKAAAAAVGSAPSTPSTETNAITMETPSNISVIPAAGKQTPQARTPQASPKPTPQASPKIIASHTVRQTTQGGKTVANLVAQQQLLKQQVLQQQVAQQKVTAVKVAAPAVKVTTATFAQPQAGGKPATSAGQLGLGAATKPVAFSILQTQPKAVGKAGGETVAQQLQARALAKQQETTKAVVSTSAGQTSVKQPTPASSPKPSATPPLNIITTKSGGKVIQQVVSSTPPASPTVLQQSIVTPSGTKAQILKIQGGSILQQQAGQNARRAALQRAQSVVTQGAVTATTPTQQVQKVTLQRAVSIDGGEVRALTEGHLPAGANVIQTSTGKTVNVANLSGGAGTTIVITKPGTPPVSAGVGKTVVATSGAIAQLIQAVPGNHGKPIMIGGKPAYLSGKPIQLIGRQGQIGVIAPGQGQQVLSGVSIVTQAGTSGTTTSSTSQTRVIAQSPSGSSTPTLVSQILQGATVQQGKVTGHGQKVQVVQQGGQTRLVTPAGTAGGQGIVVTQLTAPGGKPGQAKVISGAQAGMLAGSQFIVQQGSPSKVIGQQILTTSGTRPTILATSQGGTPRTGTANIQLVRTVLSQQQAGKAQAAGGQQSTIVLAQPGSATHTVVTDVKNLQTVAGRGKTGGPVYARLIQPPGQIRLATVRTGTPTSATTAVRLAGATNVAGLNVIQAQRVQTPDGVQIITTTAPRGQVTETVQVVSASESTVVQSPEGNAE